MSELNPEITGDEDLTAAEYVLGVLGEGARRAAETRAGREPSFAREIEAWQERLYPMAAVVMPVTPPAHVWSRIQRALSPGENRVIDLAQRRAVSFWRNWAVAATAAAAVALVFLAVRPPAPPVAPIISATQPLLIAELVDKTGRGFVTASYDPAKGELHAVPSSPVPVGAKRAAELWLIPADGVPRSLGVIDAAQPTVLKVGEALRPGARETAVLAITSEQPGGSPTGKPTTKPLWIGKLAIA